MGFSGPGGPGEGGFTSTPRAGAPRFPGRAGGVWDPGGGRGGPGDPGPPVAGTRRDAGTRSPGPRSGTPVPGNRGAPPRGVDVKPL